MKRWVVLAVPLLSLGCRSHQMTAADCQTVLDRIVDIELAESGYRDPVLSARRKAELRTRFAAELAVCEGRRVRAHGQVGPGRRDRRLRRLSVV